MSIARSAAFRIPASLATGLWFCFAAHSSDELPAGAEGTRPPLGGPTLDAIRFRSIGPTSMGGRITDLAVDPGDANVVYVASASGGLFKSTNRSLTFQAVFDRGGAASIGAVAVAPSDPRTVWVGTGEANPRNSVSWGDGVYVSRDAGETWAHVGLRETRHVGRIAVDPRDAGRVFVAAMGHTWGPNPERGLFRTDDYGQSWRRVLFVDENTGCIDVAIDPDDPDVVYAATWQRQRGPLDDDDPVVQNGAGSALFRSDDGGTTWKRLRTGLPTRPLGRVGLAVYPRDPSIVYAVVATDRTGKVEGAPVRSEDRASIGVRGRNHARGFEIVAVTPGGPCELAGLRPGDVIVRVGPNPVADVAELGRAIEALRPGEPVEIAFLHDDEETVVRVEPIGRVLSSGRRDLGAGMQGGQIQNAQDDQGEDGFETGGVFRSDDRGETWRRVNSLNPRPFYYSQIRVDPTDADVVYVLGISLHRSTDGGKTFDTRAGVGTHSDHHAMWIDPADPRHVLLGNDGGLYQSFDGCRTWDFVDVLPLAQFYAVAVDRGDPYRVFGGLQDNGTWVGPSSVRRSSGAAPEDWYTILGGDGFVCAVDPQDDDVVYCESQNGGIARVDLRTGERSQVARPRGDGHRYHWRTPLLIPEREPGVLLFAGTHVVRSVDEGRSYKVISDYLPRTDEGAVTALSASPLDEDILVAGTDDGALWTTSDGGRSWRRVDENLPVGRPVYVAATQGSRHAATRLYAVLDAHRQDDYRPYVYRSDDLGASWEDLGGGLPEDASARCIAEDPHNPDVLLCGTERGCFASLDGGRRWSRLDLPPVPVHGVLVHPDESDLVVATHGRGVFIGDAWPLRHLVREGEPSEGLLPLEPARAQPRGFSSGDYGSGRFRAENPPRGASFWYWLDGDPPDRVELEIRDVEGELVARVRAGATRGLNHASWNLGRADRSRGPGGRGPRGGLEVEPGDYLVTLRSGSREWTRSLRIEASRTLPGGTLGR